RKASMYHKKLTAALAIAVLGSASGVALADKPGADWITLEQAVQKAKSAGYTQLHSISADDDTWEGEGMKADGKVWEFKMDGKTGDMTKEKEYRSQRPCRSERKGPAAETPQWHHSFVVHVRE